jgi:ketosteroid isomerase-like protein
MSTTDGDISRAGDLGYVYGKYRLSADGPIAGAYIRMWTRQAAGDWVLQLDAVVPIN